MMKDFIARATEIGTNIKDEDTQSCWNLLLRCPEEMFFLDDWIDYLYDESGCSGFNVLTMDILYNQNRDKVMVSFLRENHTCDRFLLGDSLKQLRHYFALEGEMRG